MPLTSKPFWNYHTVYMFDFNLIVSFFILIAILYILFNLSQIVSKQSKILNEDINKKLDLQRSEFLESVTDKINRSSNQQITQLLENKPQLDLKFQQIQNNISLANNNHTNNQKNEFLELRSINQESFIELQKQIQESLSKAITDLSSLTSQNFETLRRTNQEKLDQINTEVQKKLDENFAQHLRSFDEVSKSVGHVQSLAQRMIDSTVSIDKLNNVFSRTASKSFGDFGEKYLELLLKENLSSTSWSSQVSPANSSEKIDFVINLEDKKIGIDSKFPLTKYQDYLQSSQQNQVQAHKDFLSAVKKMAEDISKKYSKIGFVDYLFLYLPSDSMYTLVADDHDTIDFLQRRGISPISPITIFPVILGIRNYQYQENINENAENIIKGLKIIGQSIRSFQEEFRKLGEKIRLAQGNYDCAERNLYLISKEINVLDSIHNKPESLL
jgi:DNA recombination protein RmuC